MKLNSPKDTKQGGIVTKLVVGTFVWIRGEEERRVTKTNLFKNFPLNGSSSLDEC